MMDLGVSIVIIGIGFMLNNSLVKIIKELKNLRQTSEVSE